MRQKAGPRGAGATAWVFWRGISGVLASWNCYGGNEIVVTRVTPRFVGGLRAAAGRVLWRSWWPWARCCLHRRVYKGGRRVAGAENQELRVG